MKPENDVDLADVLGVLTKRDAERWRDTLTTRDIRVTVDDEAVGVGAFFDHRQHDFRWPWRHTSPADALGALALGAQRHGRVRTYDRSPRCAWDSLDGDAP